MGFGLGEANQIITSTFAGQPARQTPNVERQTLRFAGFFVIFVGWSPWKRLRFSDLAKESVIEFFSCSIVMLQSRHETYLPLTSCTRNYPGINGRAEASCARQEGVGPHGGTNNLQR